MNKDQIKLDTEDKFYFKNVPFLGGLSKEMIVHLLFWKEIITAKQQDHLASHLRLITVALEPVVVLNSSEQSAYENKQKIFGIMIVCVYLAL